MDGCVHGCEGHFLFQAMSRVVMVVLVVDGVVSVGLVAGFVFVFTCPCFRRDPNPIGVHCFSSRNSLVAARIQMLSFILPTAEVLPPYLHIST